MNYGADSTRVRQAESDDASKLIQMTILAFKGGSYVFTLITS